jgi:lipopolysaccharide transport system ATP-binding protein
MEPIIKVENLGKSYIIGHQREKYVALRDVLTNKARQVASKTKNLFSGGQLIAGNEMEEFWALKDINFEVQQGDRVGIIGRNGAGKHLIKSIEPNYRTYYRANTHAGPGSQSIGSRNRFSS